MSDERLRDLERRWRATAAVDDATAYLQERLRAGLVRQEALDLAAALGFEPARRLVEQADACPDDELLPRLARVRVDPLQVAADVAAIGLACAREVAPAWTEAYGGDGAERVVRALQACLACPCALHADATRMAALCLTPPWVGGGPVHDGADRARAAARLVHAASDLAQQYVRATLGETPDDRRRESRLQSDLQRADAVVGEDRRRLAVAGMLGPRLVGLARTGDTVEEPEAPLPVRPPIDETLGSLQSDLRWANERIATIRAVCTTDPAQAELELGHLVGDLRDATEAVAEILRMVAAWDELRRRRSERDEPRG